MKLKRDSIVLLITFLLMGINFAVDNPSAIASPIDGNNKTVRSVHQYNSTNDNSGRYNPSNSTDRKIHLTTQQTKKMPNSYDQNSHQTNEHHYKKHSKAMKFNNQQKIMNWQRRHYISNGIHISVVILLAALAIFAFLRLMKHLIWTPNGVRFKNFNR